MFYIIKQQIDHHGSFYFSLIGVLVFFSTRLLVFRYFVLDLVNPWQRPQAGRGHGQSVWLVWSLLSSYWLLFLLASNGLSNCSFSFLLSWCSLYLTSLLAPLHILIIVSDREWDRRQGEGRLCWYWLEMIFNIKWPRIHSMFVHSFDGLVHELWFFFFFYLRVGDQFFLIFCVFWGKAMFREQLSFLLLFFAWLVFNCLRGKL